MAGGLFESSGGAHAIWLAPDGVQTYVYPPKTPGVGQDLLHTNPPDRAVDALAALSTHATVVSQPQLGPAGLEMDARLAIYWQSHFWGLVTISLDLPVVFKEAGLDTAAANAQLALRERGRTGAVRQRRRIYQRPGDRAGQFSRRQLEPGGPAGGRLDRPHPGRAVADPPDRPGGHADGGRPDLPQRGPPDPPGAGRQRAHPPIGPGAGRAHAHRTGAARQRGKIPHPGGHLGRRHPAANPHRRDRGLQFGRLPPVRLYAGRVCPAGDGRPGARERGPPAAQGDHQGPDHRRRLCGNGLQAPQQPHRLRPRSARR